MPRPLLFAFFAFVVLFSLGGDAVAAPPPSASASASAAPAASGAPAGSAGLDQGKPAADKASDKDKKSAGPIKVYVGWHVISIRSVDLRAQSFYADFYMWFRFSGVDDDTAKAIEGSKGFMNGKPDTETVATPEKMIGDDTRYICWREQGTFTFEAKLQKYPFDTQELDIALENEDLEAKDMVFVNDTDTYIRSHQEENRWAIRSDVEIPEFRLKKVDLAVEDSLYKTDFGDLTPTEVGGESHYSRASIKMYFQRDFMPYVYKILIPLAVIIAMAYIVFFLPAKEVSTATGITITALLSCIAFQVTVAQNMPDVGYLVVSDKFFIASYFLVFITLVQNITTYALDEAGKVKQAERIEKIARVAFPILYVLMFGYLLKQASDG
jgi:hypothetical protein